MDNKRKKDFNDEDENNNLENDRWDIFNQKIGMAIKFKREGNYERALECYKELNAEYPNDWDVYRSWAKTLVSSGDYDLGLEYFIKSNQLIESAKPNSEQPVKILGVVPNTDESLALGIIPKSDNEEFIDILLNEPRDSKRFLNFLKRVSGNQDYVVDNETIKDKHYYDYLLTKTDRKVAQKMLDDTKKLDKYFLIAANVYPEEWGLDFNRDLNYNEIIYAFTFCFKSLTSNFNDLEKKDWIANFFGLFPQTEEEREQQNEIFKKPKTMIENKNNFVLFVVDFTKGSFCGFKSNCSITAITQIIYYYFQLIKEQVGNDTDAVRDLIDMMEKFELINKVKDDKASTIKNEWIELFDKFTGKKEDDYVNYNNLNKITHQKILIGSTLDEMNMKKTNLIPWLKKFLPDNKKRDKFLTYIADVLGSKKYKDLSLEGLREEIAINDDLHFKDANCLYAEAWELKHVGDYVGAVEKMDLAIASYEKKIGEFKKKRGIKTEIFIDENPLARAYFSKGQILLRLHRMEEAFDCQDKAIDLDPNNDDYC